MVVILFICFHLNGSAATVFVVLIDNNAADLRGKGATGDPAIVYQAAFLCHHGQGYGKHRDKCNARKDFSLHFT
ncbi:hypothetical protein C1C17_04000 [Salmonella enterica subsp. houtenae serovar 40:z4,z24:-]|nr:hypothetical protein [Salmonella enterica subsp. houtenae serovar 40:z4,z24:-]